MVRYSFLVRLSHPLLHAGLIPALSLITRSQRPLFHTLPEPGRSNIGIFIKQKDD
jgi:hypothetical protein